MTFDMQKARKICGNLRLGNDQQTINAANMLPAALDEIEQLDREVCVARNLASLAKGIVDEQAKRIAELDADAQRLHDRKEEFATELVKANQRIVELENALVEERAICTWYIVDWIECDETNRRPKWTEAEPMSRDHYLKQARHQLHQEKLL